MNGRSRLKHIRTRSDKVGARPGTLAIRTAAPVPKISVITYGAESLEERHVTNATDLRGLVADSAVTWIDVQGLGDEAVLKNFGKSFSLHPLLLEDIVNVPQRPKLEEYGDHLVFVTRMLRYTERGELDREQLSIVLGKNHVLTFQEKYGDVLDPVRNRLRAAKGLIRGSGPDYLAYAILDTVIDGYFPVLERLGERLESLDEQVIADPSNALLREIHHDKGCLLILRRLIWPQRDALNRLIRDGSPLIDQSLEVYFRDTQDHCMQVAEVVEAYRELAGGLVNAHLSALSNRMNEIMKVLTIMASIFIPLTFIAGIYGMNFEHMPELRFKLSYPLALTAMGLIALFMILAFKKRGWIGSAKPTHDIRSRTDTD